MRRRVIVLALALAATLIVLGLVFAGSPTTIANGVTIAGVDVGGMQAKDARALLERKSAAVNDRTVVFVAGGKRFRIRPVELGVEPDWKAAVAAAQRQGDGFGPIRALKRLDVQFFGADVTPPTSVLHGALDYEVSRIANAVDRKPQSASLVRHGLTLSLTPARAGRVLDRGAATRTIVHELASLETAPTTVELPLVTTLPSVQARTLARAARRARLVLSAPVRLAARPDALGPHAQAARTAARAAGRRSHRHSGLAVPPPMRGSSSSAAASEAGARCDVLGQRLAHQRRPRAAGPSPRRRRNGPGLLEAALKRRPALRVAQLPVAAQPAKLSTEAARAMHITGVVLATPPSTAASRTASTTSSSSRTSSTTS